MEMVKKSGTLSEISCPRLLAHLHRNKFDGTLRLSRGALLKLLYFQAGEIAMASSNDQADHLAPILIRAGKLKPEQMDLARKSTRPGVSLARVLVQMGFLTSGELFAGARQQLRQIVGSVLPLTDAGYEIQGGFFPREITSLNVDTRELLLDLVRDLSDRSFVLLEVGAPDTVYVPASGGNGADAAPLPRRWKDLIDRFPHPMAIRDFGQAAGLDDFSASKIVYGLSLLGRLSPERPPDELPVDDTPAAAEPEYAAPPEPAEPTSAATIQIRPEIHPPVPESVRVVPIQAAEDEVEEAPAAEVAPSGDDSAHVPFEPVRPSPATVTLQAPAEPAPEPETFTTHGEAGPSPLSSDAEPAARSPRDEAVSSPRPIRENMPFPRTANLPRNEPSRPWTILSILTGVVLLALVSYWFVFLRTPTGDAGSAAGPASNESAPDNEAARPEAAPADDTKGPAGAGEEATTVAQAPPPGAPEPAASEPPSGSGVDTAGSAGGETSPAAPPPSSAPHVSTPSAAASPAATPSGSAAGIEPPRPGTVASAAWAKARAQLDAGEHAAAARSWSQALRPQASSFTLQIAIACQEESLRKAARGTHPDEPFFVTPFLLQGRPCFRLCFGVYPSVEQAERAAGAIPAVLTEGGSRPVVIALRRITAPEGP